MSDEMVPGAPGWNEMVAALKQKHSEVFLIESDPDETDPVQVLVRRPNGTDLNKFTETSMRGRALRAMGNLVNECLLWPAADVIARRFVTAPGLAMSLGNQVFKLSGGGADFTARRL